MSAEAEAVAVDYLELIELFRVDRKIAGKRH